MMKQMEKVMICDFLCHLLTVCVIDSINFLINSVAN